MNCDSVRTWLLQVECLRPNHWPAAVTGHVKSCAACVKFVNSLSKLEKGWRDQPAPAACDRAKAAFVKKLAGKSGPAKWHPVRWVAVAATLLIGVSAVGWLLFSPEHGHASSDVVERLIDWNLDLTNADAKERLRLLAEHEARLRQDLQKAKLPPEDQKLAEHLLENGCWLAANDDPEAESERINDIADQLFVRMETASRRGSEKESTDCVLRYTKVLERGVNPLTERIARLKAPPKKGAFEHEREREMDRQRQVEKMMERAPARSRPDFHRALEALRKNAKRSGHRK